MYYTKNRGFRKGGYLKAEGEEVFGGRPFSIEIRTISPYNLPKVCGIPCVDPGLWVRRSSPWGQAGIVVLGAEK